MAFEDWESATQFKAIGSFLSVGAFVFQFLKPTYSFPFPMLVVVLVAIWAGWPIIKGIGYLLRKLENLSPSPPPPPPPPPNPQTAFNAMRVAWSYYLQAVNAPKDGLIYLGEASKALLEAQRNDPHMKLKVDSLDRKDQQVEYTQDALAALFLMTEVTYYEAERDSLIREPVPQQLFVSIGLVNDFNRRREQKIAECNSKNISALEKVIAYQPNNTTACHSACNFDPLSRGIGVQN
jgi:hypothetical protein